MTHTEIFIGDGVLPALIVERDGQKVSLLVQENERAALCPELLGMLIKAAGLAALPTADHVVGLSRLRWGRFYRIPYTPDLDRLMTVIAHISSAIRYASDEVQLQFSIGGRS